MLNRVRLSVVDHKADDFMAALEKGLFTMDAGTSELLGPEGTALFSTHGMGTELRITYTTIDSELHATGFVVRDDEGVSLRGRFEDPEPLGVPVWTDMRPLALYDALLGDSEFDVRGNRNDNAALGSDFDDRFRMGTGDDSAFGGAGDDVLNGGRGDDLLIGGPGNDRVIGGRGNDMLILGDAETSGTNTARGGAGNDVFVQLGGVADIRGGRGNDWIIIESFASTASGSPNVQTRVRDFGADDILLLADWGTPIGTLTGETLADLENGSIDEFRWRETKAGVQIHAGDSVVVLRRVTADEIDLDQILFAEASAQETVALFDGNADGEALGRTMGGDSFIAFGTETSTFITFGTETSTFIAYGNEGTGFINDTFTFG